MSASSEIQHGKHCVFNLKVHLVFVTKYRRQILTKKVMQCCARIFSDVCAKLECTLNACNGEADHVHLIVSYPPKISIAKLVNGLKGVSSYILRREVPSLAKMYFKKVLWSPSYFAASCGGAPLEKLKQYVENQ